MSPFVPTEPQHLVLLGGPELNIQGYAEDLGLTITTTPTKHAIVSEIGLRKTLTVRLRLPDDVIETFLVTEGRPLSNEPADVKYGKRKPPTITFPVWLYACEVADKAANRRLRAA